VAVKSESYFSLTRSTSQYSGNLLFVLWTE